MPALYIHFPFCLKKCPYCDFNSHKIKGDEEYLQYQRAYENELAYYKNLLPEAKITSIFFGGGTPSLMPIFLVEAILEATAKYFAINPDAEITLEANPTSFEAGNFKCLKKIGINRVSVGVQSFSDANLQFLGRQHSAQEARLAITEAINIFDNFSFDLIYALPNQNCNQWKQELQQAIRYGTPHLSLYQLTIEPGTDFFRIANKGGLKNMPSEEEKAKLYEATEEITSANGFNSYEVSNYAKSGFQSRHNLNYWQFGDYIGIGAGANGRISYYQSKSSIESQDKAGKRAGIGKVDSMMDREGGMSGEGSMSKRAMINIHNPQKWLQSALANKIGLQTEYELTSKQMLTEMLIFGLRLQKGIEKRLFITYFNKDYQEILSQEKIDALVNEGLITTTETHIKATKKGRILVRGITEFLLK